MNTAVLVKHVHVLRGTCASCGVASESHNTWWTHNSYAGPHRNTANSEWRFTGQLCADCAPTTVNGTYEQFEAFIKPLYVAQRLTS